MKLIILTAEPSNFVPVELHKAAQVLQIESEIIDITKVIIEESDEGKLFLLETAEDVPPVLTELKIDTETVVIPRLNEHHLDTKIGILKKIQNSGGMLINSPESMALCNDKLMSQIVLNKMGLHTPRSWVIQDADAFDSVIAAMETQKLLSFPIIVKTFRGTHGIGVMKIDSRSSLVSVGQTLLKEGLDFMLQEFVKHDQSCRIIMKGSELLAANLRGQPKEKDEFRTNSHLGSETKPYTPSEQELEMARSIVAEFGCNFCAIDYIMIDKEIMVLEVNGSPGLEAIQKNWPDKNLAAEVVQYAVSLGAPPADAVTATEPVVEPTEAEPTEAEPGEERLELIEPCLIHRIMEQPVEAKVDTGATTSSLHVDSFKVEGESVKFTRGDTTFRTSLHGMRHVKNNTGGPAAERPIVLLDVTVKGLRNNRVAFSLNNRDHMKYQVLIGRNLIELLGLPVSIMKLDDVKSDPAEESEIEEE